MSSTGTSPILTERAAERALLRHQDSIATGNRMFFMRRCAGVSQAELAAYLGVSRGTIQNVEHGKRALTPRERAMVARALGCSIATFTVSSNGERAAA
jgi:transcriptional regulator with XRE-family HTH domain